MDNKKEMGVWKITLPGWKVLRWTMSIILVVAFVLSLAFNLLLLLSNSAYLLASSTLSALTGTKTLITRHSDEIAELSERIVTQEVTERKLKRELANASETLAAYKAAQIDTTRRVIRRNNYAAARKVATMPARAIPMFGTGVIVGVAALELNDMCNTVEDMAKLNEILDPSSAPTEEELTVCRTKVPTRKEIFNKTATGASDAWKALKEYEIPDMDSLMDQDIPNVDWSGIRKSMVDTFDKAHEGSNDLFHKIRNWWNTE